MIGCMEVIGYVLVGDVLVVEIRYRRMALPAQRLSAIDFAHHRTPCAIGRTVDGNVQVSLDILDHHIGQAAQHHL